MADKQDEVQEAKAFLHSILEHSEQISKLKFYARLENGATFRYDVDRAKIEREERRWETPPAAYFSAIICTIGAVLSAVAFILLVVYTALGRDPWRISVFACFGGALLITYALGALFYFFRSSSAKQVLGILRNSFFYLLLVASVSPIFLIQNRGISSFILCGVIILLAAVAAVFESVFKRASIFVSSLSSFAIIWLCTLSTNSLTTKISTLSLFLFMSGGFLSTLWAIFHALEKARPTTGVFGFREISNLCLLAGSFFYFFAWLGFVV
jgi:hemolysin III